MDVKKENSLAVTSRERTKSNRREIRRSADEEGVGKHRQEADVKNLATNVVVEERSSLCQQAC